MAKKGEILRVNPKAKIVYYKGDLADIQEQCTVYALAGFKFQKSGRKDKEYYLSKLQSKEDKQKFNELCKTGKLSGWKDAVKWAKEEKGIK